MNIVPKFSLIFYLFIYTSCLSNSSDAANNKLLQKDSTTIFFKLKKDERCLFNYCDIYFTHKELSFSNSGNRDSVFSKKIWLDMPTAFNYGFGEFKGFGNVAFKRYYYLLYPGDSITFSLENGRYLKVDSLHAGRILADPDAANNSGYDIALQLNKAPKSDAEWQVNFTKYYTTLKQWLEGEKKRAGNLKSIGDTNADLISQHTDILFYKSLFNFIYKEQKFSKVIIANYHPFLTKAEALINSSGLIMSENLLPLFYGILKVRLMEKNMGFTKYELMYKEAQQINFGVLKPGLLTSFLDRVPVNSALYKTFSQDIQSRYSGTNYAQHITALEEESRRIDAIPLDDSLIQLNKTVISFDSLLKSKKDRFILADFWATWCAPCRAQFPILDSLKPYFKNQPVDFISLNIDKEERDWILTSGTEAKYLQQHNYHLIFKNKEGAIKKLGISSIPRYVLFRNGVVIVSQFTTATEPGFVSELKKIIAKYK